MFEFKSVDSKTVRFVCLLCAPKHTECCAYINSPSNLRKHVERMHPGRVEEKETAETVWFYFKILHMTAIRFWILCILWFFIKYRLPKSNCSHLLLKRFARTVAQYFYFFTQKVTFFISTYFTFTWVIFLRITFTFTYSKNFPCYFYFYSSIYSQYFEKVCI